MLGLQWNPLAAGEAAAVGREVGHNEPAFQAHGAFVRSRAKTPGCVVALAHHLEQCPHGRAAYGPRPMTRARCAKRRWGGAAPALRGDEGADLRARPRHAAGAARVQPAVADKVPGGAVARPGHPAGAAGFSRQLNAWRGRFRVSLGATPRGAMLWDWRTCARQLQVWKASALVCQASYLFLFYIFSRLPAILCGQPPRAFSAMTRTNFRLHSNPPCG